MVSPEVFTADGSTTAFELNEIVHEQDILVKEGSSVVFVGSGVTADNNVDPSYLTVDGTLRSADHELESHSHTTQQTRKQQLILPKKYLQRAQLSRWRDATINI